MDELLKEDQTFNPSTFISKVNNMFVMLCTSMMTNNLNRVSHFISKELFDKKQQELDNYNKNNIIKMYDELNVKNTLISDVQIQEDKYIVKVIIAAKYLDYEMDKTTKKIVSGNSNNRIEKDYTLILTKRRDAKQLKEVRTCPTCGSVMDINNNGICKYCGNSFNQADYDWVIDNIY